MTLGVSMLAVSVTESCVGPPNAAPSLEALRSEPNTTVITGARVELRNENWPGDTDLFVSCRHLLVGESIERPGRSLTLFADKVEFRDGASITLSGRHGSPIFVPGDQPAEGRDAARGGAGGHGGDALISGKLLINVHVSSDGGNGGRGQDGRDGKRGDPGPGGADTQTRSTFLGDEIVKEAEEGSKGLPGGDGHPPGRGGNGGNGGRVTLHGPTSGSLRASNAGGIRGLNGEPGEPGRGGPGGLGGKITVLDSAFSPEPSGAPFLVARETNRRANSGSEGAPGLPGPTLPDAEDGQAGGVDLDQQVIRPDLLRYERPWPRWALDVLLEVAADGGLGNQERGEIYLLLTELTPPSERGDDVLPDESERVQIHTFAAEMVLFFAAIDALGD